MRAAFAVCVHDAEVVLRVLIQVFGGNPVATGCRFARQRYIALEDLISVAANFYVWPVAVERLNPVWHPRAVMVQISPISAAA